MIDPAMDWRGLKDSENAPNSFFPKINRTLFWRFGTERSSYFAKLLQARGEAYSRPYFGAGSLRHPDETPGDQLHRWANHCQSQPLRQELRKNRWRQNGENWLSLLTVCFLDSWPQTKSSVTFDTCFWHCFYALSRGALGFALNGSSFNHFLIGGNSSTANQIL